MPRIARRDIRYTHSREGSGERKATSLNAEGAAPISFSMARFPNIFPRRGSRAGLLPCAGRLAACLLAGLLLNSCGWASSAEDPSEGLHGFATRNGTSRG